MKKIIALFIVVVSLILVYDVPGSGTIYKPFESHGGA